MSNVKKQKLHTEERQKSYEQKVNTCQQLQLSFLCQLTKVQGRHILEGCPGDAFSP